MGVSEVAYGDRTIMSITDSTVTPETLADGAVAYGADGERIVGKMTMDLPIGHEWWTANPTIPTGCLPLFGGTYSRTAYKDLWAWVQTQGSYLISESEWQTKATANDGNVAFYSDGDGSTTFRVPSLKCHVQGANGVEKVGSYLAAGLPNIEGYVANLGLNSNETKADYSGAFVPSASTNNYGGSSSGNPKTNLAFDASTSNSIYGASDTVQPASVIGMYLVKAFGTVSNVGNQDIADISAGLTSVEERLASIPFTARATAVGDASETKPAVVVTSYQNGSNWYRVWSDGWLEQGGITDNCANKTTTTITLNKNMYDNTYHIQLMSIQSDDDADYNNSVYIVNESPTTTNFQIYTREENTVRKYYWYVYGRGA